MCVCSDILLHSLIKDRLLPALVNSSTGMRWDFSSLECCAIRLNVFVLPFWLINTLKASAPPDYAATIEAALARLTDENRTGMGRLFKALAVSDPKLDALPGFDA